MHHEKSSLEYCMTFKLFFQISIITGFLFSQSRIAEYEVHKRGELWDTMSDDGTHGAYPQPTGEFKPSMDWPGGPTVFNGPFEQRSYLYKAGVWMGGKINDQIFLTKNGPFEVDINSTFEEINKEENFIGSSDYTYEQAEEKITASWTTSKNIKVKRTSRSWSMRGVNNFIIITYDIMNLNQDIIDDFYFCNVFLMRPSSQDYNSHAGWNDALSRADDVVGIDTLMKMIYAHDGTGSYDFTSGVGNWSDGNLLTHGYTGFASINAPNDKFDLPQPQRFILSNYIVNQSYFKLSTQNEQSIYNIISGLDNSFQSSQGDTIDPIAIMPFGPYQLGADQSISISIVQAVNGLNLDDVSDLEAGQMSMIQTRYINEGLDSLRLSIQNAKTLFENSFILDKYPPPSPLNIELLASPANQSISIRWDPVEDTWENPITGRKDIEKYVVYRSENRFIGPYDVIKNRIRVHKSFDKNAFFDDFNAKWEYVDSDISLGVSYFYAVTAIDSTGKESWLTNRNEIPLQAVRAPRDNALEIKVFPNPFKITSGIPTVGQENMISWTNLPSPCEISIFTANGELIKKISHRGNTGDASWDQRTSSRLITSPGIYFWGVQSNFGNAKGTLLIVK